MMTTDPQTHSVYFSNLLPEAYPEECNAFFALIGDAGFKVKLLRATHDFYCRDYMPLQLSENDFVQFIFRPKAYFESEWYEEISNPIVCELTNNITPPRYSPLILDGGNVIIYGNKAIVTDRVLKDNRYQFPSDAAIIERLVFDLTPASSKETCQVIIIPEYPGEATGHADGLVRFIDENRVFINELESDPQKAWQAQLLEILREHKLEYLEMPCEVAKGMETADGLYLNYLQVGNLIIAPQFGMLPGDKKALHTLTEIFGHSHTVVPFKANWIADNGGVFNCMSWVVKE